jgi:ATP-dependent DNA helicase RecG
LAEILEITVKGVEWNIKKLKEKGIVRRIGPAKGGYWKVVEK